MFLTPFFTGKAKLWQAYWLVWFLPGLIIAGIALGLAFYLLDNPDAPQILALLTPVAPVFILLIGIYQLCAPYIVWKCSANTSHKGWSSLARITLVLGILFGVSWSIPGAIAVSSATLIIILYLIAKISKNPKLIRFNAIYAIPILLVIGYFGTYVAGFFFK